MSSPSASPPVEDKMQINVINVAGTNSKLATFIDHLSTLLTPILATTLTIPANTSIATVKSLLALNQANPSASSTPSSNLRLTYAGRQLDNAELSLEDYAIPPSATLHLAPPLNDDAAQAKTPSTPKKSRIPRCAFKDCKQKPQPIVGDCGFCNLRFCSKHRMLESHACAGLDDCKKESKQRNTERLEGERTSMIRGI